MPAASTDAIFVGVDTHADTHHVAVVDHLGRHLGDREFPADPAGCRSLLDWMSSFGSVTGVGVEGTGTYGAQLGRVLRAAAWRCSRSTGPTAQHGVPTASLIPLTPTRQRKRWPLVGLRACRNPEMASWSPSAARG